MSSQQGGISLEVRVDMDNRFQADLVRIGFLIMALKKKKHKVGMAGGWVWPRLSVCI